MKEYIKRSALLIGGLAITAVGVALMLQANVGLEAWSVLQQGISKTCGMTFGAASVIVGVIVIVLAILCGEKFGIGTLGNIFLCGPMIDFILYLDVIPKMESLVSGIVMLLAGMELLAIGTWLYMTSTLGVGPRDALMVALARKTGRSVGLCRSTVELIAIFVGWRLGGQVGVGTVIAAVGVGILFNLTFGLLHFRAAELHQENLAETFHKIRAAQ